EDENCSSTLRGVAGSGVGFFVAHTVAVIPTIRRRNQIKAETDILAKSIEKNLEKLANFDYKGANKVTCDTINLQVKRVLTKTLTMTLPIKKRGDAALNLIAIKKLVTAIDRHVCDMMKTLAQSKGREASNVLGRERTFWSKNFAEIKEKLMNKASASPIVEIPAGMSPT
ncbi:MAG: hypothetical protein Q8R79_07140, partial [Legionellaceae bacterium]|nr:hypothetical protein [Legionellaceae bacterium]